MDKLFETSLFAGVTISLVAYIIGMALKKKFKLAILNPLLISIILTIVVLVAVEFIEKKHKSGSPRDYGRSAYKPCNSACIICDHGTFT